MKTTNESKGLKFREAAVIFQRQLGDFEAQARAASADLGKVRAVDGGVLFADIRTDAKHIVVPQNGRD